MTLVLRTGRPEDAALLGEICYRAFGTLAQAHGIVPDIPDANVAAGMMTGLIGHAGSLMSMGLYNPPNGAWLPSIPY